MADGNPWAWTGLLKWSLNYVDGTQDNENATPLSAEDRAFLEKVMKEGIVDEGERMTFILQQATDAMEYYRISSSSYETDESKNYNDGEGKDHEENSVGKEPISEEELEELLQELRDIVEQIDYARAFCSMGGLQFLLGCIQQQEVPESIRCGSLQILSTVSQNNPPVQQQLLEIGAIKTLCDLFFLESTKDKTRTKIMQCISSIVRNHDVSEQVFTALPQAVDLIFQGLDPTLATTSLRSTTLFFLKAFLTSDLTDRKRMEIFQGVLLFVIDTYILGEEEGSSSSQLRELAVAFLEQVLIDHKGGTRIVLMRKKALVGRAVKCIASLRTLTGDDREYAEPELEHWENFMVLLARAEPEVE